MYGQGERKSSRICRPFFKVVVLASAQIQGHIGLRLKNIAFGHNDAEFKHESSHQLDVMRYHNGKSESVYPVFDRNVLLAVE